MNRRADTRQTETCYMLIYCFECVNLCDDMLHLFHMLKTSRINSYVSHYSMSFVKYVNTEKHPSVVCISLGYECCGCVGVCRQTQALLNILNQLK